MGIRLQGGFTSVKEEDVYVINIHDSDYSSTVINFDLFKDGLTINKDHQDKGRNVSILTSKCKIRMILDDSDKLSFLQDVVSSAEGRFRVEILKNTNKYWYGYIMPDLLDRQDIPYSINPQLTIQATDGIGRLQKIDYNDDGSSYTGKETFIDHIFNILEKIGFEDFYSASEDYLVTYVNWWDTNHAYNTSTNPLELTRFDHKALIEVDRSGEVIYNNAFDVLQHMVKAWNCRLEFSEGAYYLIQINAYETDGSTKVLKIYDKDKTLSTTSTTDFATWTKRTGNLDLYQDGTYEAYHNNGRFRYYPALRKVEVSYEHYSTENFIPGYTWSNVLAPTATFSAIDYNDGAARLIFNAKLETRADFDTPADFQVCIYRFRIQFKVGTKYLVRSSSFVNGNFVLSELSWSSSIGYVDVYSEWMYLDNSPRYLDVSFITPELLEDGDLEVIVSKFGHYNTAGDQIFTGADAFTAYWAWEDTSVQIYVDGNLEGQTNVALYTATNDDGSTNSETEEVPLLIGDGPSGNTFGAMQVYDGSGWVDSSGWRKGNSGDYITFGQLLANELMAGQIFAIERYIGDVTGDFLSHGRLQRIISSTATNYIFIGGSLNCHKDIWSGEWIQVDIDNLRVTASGGRNFTSSPGKPRRFAGSGRNIGGISRTATLPTSIDIPLIVPNGQPAAINSINLALGILFPQTDDTIDEGDTVTQIPIPDRTVDGEYKVGQTVTLTNPFTGSQQNFTVTANTESGDTYISVSSQAAGFDFPASSWVITSQETQQVLGGSGGAYREEFATHASATITVTAGTLPTNAAAIRLYYDNGQVISPNYWSHSANVITLTYTPNGAQSIWVEFTT